MKTDFFSLSGKVIVITGAAGLLGRQHAEAVASSGGIPVLLDLRDEAIVVAQKLANEYNVPASGWVVDITQENFVQQNCATLLERYGKIDGLINNAANNPKVEDSDNMAFSRLENFPIGLWNSDVAVGLTGAFLCSKYFGSSIADNPDGGSIINISSDLGLIAPDQRLYRKEGVPEHLQPVKPVTYSVVKTGLIGLTRYLATYWADRKVRCNAFCPGGVENNQDRAFLLDVSSRIPMGRLARPDEYRGFVTFLLSQASSYVNGAIIAVDGGRSCW